MPKRTIFGKNPHYQFRNQDPIIDTMRYFWRASGHSLQKLSETTNLGYSTLYNWFVLKKTRSPRHESVKIFFNSFGIAYGLPDEQAKKVRRGNLKVVA